MRLYKPTLATAAATCAFAASTGQAAALPTSQAVTESSGHSVSVKSHTVRAGVVTLSLSSKVSRKTGFDLQVFKLRPGTKPADFRDALAFNFFDPQSSSDGALWLLQHVVLLGGNPGGTPATEQIVLTAGTYYAADLSEWVKTNGRKGIASFKVAGSAAGAVLPKPSRSITMTRTKHGPRYVIKPGKLSPGWVRVDNPTAAMHTISMERVKAKATAGDVILFFEGIGPDVFAGGPVLGMDAVSPRVSLNFRLDGPAGRYSVIDYMPDPVSGFPFFQEGMLSFVQLTG